MNISLRNQQPIIRMNVCMILLRQYQPWTEFKHIDLPAIQRYFSYDEAKWLQKKCREHYNRTKKGATFLLPNGVKAVKRWSSVASRNADSERGYFIWTMQDGTQVTITSDWQYHLQMKEMGFHAETLRMLGLIGRMWLPEDPDEWDRVGGPPLIRGFLSERGICTATWSV